MIWTESGLERVTLVLLRSLGHFIYIIGTNFKSNPFTPSQASDSGSDMTLASLGNGSCQAQHRGPDMNIYKPGRNLLKIEDLRNVDLKDDGFEKLASESIH